MRAQKAEHSDTRRHNVYYRTRHILGGKVFNTMAESVAFADDLRPYDRCFARMKARCRAFIREVLHICATVHACALMCDHSRAE